MLTTAQIQAIVADYFKDKPVKKVYLFGSYARGDADEKSDVDLSFVLNEDAAMSYFTLAGYLMDLEAKLKKKIDLVEDKMIFEQIKPYIEPYKILITDQ